MNSVWLMIFILKFVSWVSQIIWQGTCSSQQEQIQMLQSKLDSANSKLRVRCDFQNLLFVAIWYSIIYFIFLMIRCLLLTNMLLEYYYCLFIILFLMSLFTCHNLIKPPILHCYFRWLIQQLWKREWSLNRKKGWWKS